MKDSPQIDHIAFKANDVRAISARLKAANVKFDRELHDGIYGLTIYVFDPDALGPQCGTVKLVMYSEKEPKKGDTRVVDPRVLQQIWQDFAPYREL